MTKKITESEIVPDGTPVDDLAAFIALADNEEQPPTGDQLAAHFNRHERKTVESILVQAVAVHRASYLRDKEELTFFLKVGFGKDSPTFRKWNQIGREVTRFQPFINRLPPNWTTI